MFSLNYHEAPISFHVFLRNNDTDIQAPGKETIIILRLYEDSFGDTFHPEVSYYYIASYVFTLFCRDCEYKNGFYVGV